MSWSCWWSLCWNQNIPLGIIKSMKYVRKMIYRKCYDTNWKWHIGWSCYTQVFNSRVSNCMLFNSVTCSNQPAAVFRSVKCCSGFCNTLIFLVNFVFLVFAASGSRTGREGVVEGFLAKLNVNELWFVPCSLAVPWRNRSWEVNRKKKCYVWQSSMTCNMLHGLQSKIRQRS